MMASNLSDMSSETYGESVDQRAEKRYKDLDYLVRKIEVD